MNISSLSASELRKAATIKDQIDSLQTELIKILGTEAKRKRGPGRPPRKRRKMSAAARAKIGAAQKARWAKLKAAKK